jgi:riboflavin synthase
MFTGLIEAVGTVTRVEPRGDERVLDVRTTLAADLAPGDSIAVNGVCLTVTERHADVFRAHVSPETLRVTSLARLAAGTLVNLERPLRSDARLGGHFVLGHVDGVGVVRAVDPDGESWRLEIDAPASLEGLMVPKGSIAVDGISLTIAALSSRRVGIQIVPFTWEHTSIRTLRPGDRVNLEADIIGKYVARLLEAQVSRS